MTSQIPIFQTNHPTNKGKDGNQTTRKFLFHLLQGRLIPSTYRTYSSNNYIEFSPKLLDSASPNILQRFYEHFIPCRKERNLFSKEEFQGSFFTFQGRSLPSIYRTYSINVHLRLLWIVSSSATNG